MVSSDWNGAEALRSLLVPLDKITEHPDNPRRGDVIEISRSLKRFGQMKPIVVSKAGVIGAGNHTYRAAKEVGWTHIAAVLVDLSEDELRAYLIADNRLSDLGRYEDDMLAGILDRLHNDNLLEGTGWYEDDISDLHNMIEKRNADIAAIAPHEPVEPQDNQSQRHVVLTFDPQEYDEFTSMITHLERALETSGIAQTTFIAVRRQAEAEDYEGFGNG